YARAPEAAYAAVLAYQRNATEVPPAQKTAALRQSIQASQKFGEKFPQHAKALAAVTRAAEDLAVLQAWDEAIAMAERVLKSAPPRTTTPRPCSSPPRTGRRRPPCWRVSAPRSRPARSSATSTRSWPWLTRAAVTRWKPRRCSSALPHAPRKSRTCGSKRRGW